MDGSTRPAWLRYAVAVLAVVLVAPALAIPAVREGAGTPALVSLLAVLVAAWYGGLGPGLLAMALLVGLTVPPSLPWWRVVRLGLFVACGATTSLLMHRLHVARRRAESANRAKDEILAALSHELRTPLTPVLAAASALLDDPATPAEVRPVLQLTRDNVALEARLIDDLLDVARIGRGELSVERRAVDAHALARRAVELCREQVEGARLALAVDLAAAEHHVEADPSRLQQVFWNLVRNAAKFTPPGGRIAVRSRNEAGPSGRTLAVEVADTGIGIEPHRLPEVFDAFRKARGPTAGRYGGLGLGLAISRAVVDAHGGRLTAASDGLGRGATFTVALATVPAAPVEAGPPPAPAAGHRPAPGRPPKVLLVEDDANTARVLARLLRARGYAVTTAGGVAEASEAAGSGDFDVVVSDIGLPDGTGWDLMPRLRDRGLTRGIALSGFGQDEDVRRSREAGFSAHLTKPVDLPELEQAIRRVAGDGS